jgi:hypothetical protein
VKGSSAAHTALVRAILAQLGAMSGVVLGTNPSGRAVFMGEDGKRRWLPFGWPAPGGPDILAAVAPHGRLVALEVKTGEARLSAEQRACHEALRAVGVAVHVVRSVDDARASLDGKSD